MSGIGQRFPEFSLTGVVSNETDKAFQPFTQDSFPGKWKVVFFWPKDFTFVCPTEIRALSDRLSELQDLDTEVLGASTDSVLSAAFSAEKIQTSPPIAPAKKDTAP